MGQRLAKDVPQNQLQAMPLPNTYDVQEFGAELADLADAWLDRNNDETLASGLAFLNNPEVISAWETYIGGQADIGVVPWQKISTVDLHGSLGYTNGLPFTFRKYTCGDSKNFPPGATGDVPFAGSTKVVIAWHQLVYVVALLSKMTNPTLTDLADLHHSAGPPSDSYWLIEKWAAVPGIGLFDEVGLGKTMCAMAAIATLQNLYLLAERAKGRPLDQRTLPKCLDGECRRATDWYACAKYFLGLSFGCRDGIPNAAHLIAVPNSLLSQWQSELSRFFHPNRVHILVIGSEALKWPAEMKRIRDSPRSPFLRIVLISHTVSGQPSLPGSC